MKETQKDKCCQPNDCQHVNYERPIRVNATSQTSVSTSSIYSTTAFTFVVSLQLYLPSIFWSSFHGCMVTRDQPSTQPRGDPAKCMVKVFPMSLVQLTKWAERGVPRPRGNTWARYRLVRVFLPDRASRGHYGFLGQALYLLGWSLLGSWRHKGSGP